MSRTTKIILSVACISVLLAVLLRAISSNECGKNSDAVLYAKSLSQDQLAQLYKSMEHQANLIGHNGITDITIVPEDKNTEFSTLKFINIKISEIRARIMLAGCMDHYVILSFKGLFGNEPKSIKVSSGEPPTWDILWQQ